MQTHSLPVAFGRTNHCTRFLQGRFSLAKNANLKNISSFSDSPQSILGEPENVSMSSIVINVKDLFERENSVGDSFHDL